MFKNIYDFCSSTYGLARQLYITPRSEQTDTFRDIEAGNRGCIMVDIDGRNPKKYKDEDIKEEEATQNSSLGNYKKIYPFLKILRSDSSDANYTKQEESNIQMLHNIQPEVEEIEKENSSKSIKMDLKYSKKIIRKHKRVSFEESQKMEPSKKISGNKNIGKAYYGSFNRKMTKSRRSSTFKSPLESSAYVTTAAQYKENKKAGRKRSKLGNRDTHEKIQSVVPDTFRSRLSWDESSKNKAKTLITAYELSCNFVYILNQFEKITSKSREIALETSGSGKTLINTNQKKEIITYIKNTLREITDLVETFYRNAFTNSDGVDFGLLIILMPNSQQIEFGVFLRNLYTDIYEAHQFTVRNLYNIQMALSNLNELDKREVDMLIYKISKFEKTCNEKLFCTHQKYDLW